MPAKTSTGEQLKLQSDSQIDLQRLRRSLNAAFLERSDLIDGILATLLAGQNTLLYGEPGTGKSEIIRAVCGAIEGAVYFQKLLHKAQPPEELLGQLSLKELENDRLVRNTTHRLPEAHIAFLDELFRCSPTTLNSLLGILNERTIENPNPIQIPLIALFSASNTVPDQRETELQALWDRFVYRPHVPYLKDRAKAQLLDWAIEGTRPVVPVGLITLVQLKQIQFEAQNLPMSPAVRSELLKIIRALAEKGFVVSDRRLVQLSRFLRCFAYVQGMDAVYLEQFEILPACIWSRDLKELGEVTKLVQETCPPVSRLLRDLVRDAQKLLDEVEGKLESSPADVISRSSDFAIVGISKLIDRISEIQQSKLSTLAESKFIDALTSLNEMKERVVAIKEQYCY